MIDAVVTGRSLPALQTALDLAEMGLQVVVLDDAATEAPSQWAERDPDGIIRAFAKRIGTAIDHAAAGAEAAQLVELPASPPLLLQKTAWLPQPEPNVLGIPAVPLASESAAALGSGGAFRAYLDRLTPLLTVGKTRMFGTLVQKRMGTKVRDRLVDPQVFERFGAAASAVEAAIAAPGLNEALSRAGSLSTAVLAYADRNVARETRVKPALGAVRFAEEALHRLELYGVRLSSDRAASIVRNDTAWVLQLEDGEVLETRSLVADIGASAIASDALQPHVGQALPREARAYASMFMERPEWLPKASRAIARVQDWAIEIDASIEVGMPGNTYSAMESAASKPGEMCVVHAIFKASEVSDQAAALAELRSQDPASAVKGHVGTSLGIEWLRGASLRQTALHAAPYRTIADRTEAENALAECEGDMQNLVIVGRAVHGDDQAAALSAAHVSAVHLRRRLLGLVE